MYTHNIKFRVGDGAYYIDAELGIDPSTKDIIYRLKSTSEPLRNELLEDFLEFTNDFKLMTEKYKTINELSIIKK